MMEIVLDAALRGTLVLLAALAATALMRRSSASARHLVWLAALAALLVLPLARQAVPEWRVLPAAPAGWAPQAAAAQPDAAPSFAADGGAGPAAETAARPPAARTPVDGPRAALGLWAAVSALLLLRLLWGVLRIRWIERRATELTDEGWVAMTDSLSRRLGLGRIVRLLRHGTARVPMTWGLVRPVVLLPAEADGWDAERRRVVLAHELAHVRRWDALTQWVAHLATALFWFHPLVWVAAHRLRQERERACDDAVLEIGTVPAAYAEHLLTLVRSLGRARAPVAALAMARRSQFEGRLLAILDSAVRRSAVSRAAGLATAAAALACLLPLAALRTAEAAPVRAVAFPPEAPADATPQLAPHPEPDRVAAGPHGRAATTPPAESSAGEVEAGDAVAEQEVEAMLAAAGRLGSDPEKRRAVIGVFAHRAFRARSDVPPVLLDVLRGMSSPTEQRRVLTALWGVRQWDQSCLVTFLEHVPSVGSDTERRRILAGAAERQRLGSDARRAYVAAAQSIGDEADRRAALAALPAAPGRAAERQPGETKWDTDIHLTGTRDGRPRTIVLRASDMFFRSARSDPHRIGPGGELYLEERRDGVVRVVRALPGPGGRARVHLHRRRPAARLHRRDRDWMAAIIREVTGS
jgi:beta-lactamase regulating signal transducer with metallopeptidase domain